MNTCCCQTYTESLFKCPCSAKITQSMEKQYQIQWEESCFISLLSSMNKDLRTQEKEIVIPQGPGYSKIYANTVVYSADPMYFLYGNYNQDMFMYGNGIYTHHGNVEIIK